MTKPADIAILNCIPLNKNDWDERAALNPCGDFVRFVSETRFKGDVNNAWNFFEAEAKFIKEKLEKFESLGSMINFRATANDIKNAAQSFKDVILIAHWKGPRVLRKDIVEPVNLLEFLLSEKIVILPISIQIDGDNPQLHSVLMEFVLSGTKNQTGISLDGDKSGLRNQFDTEDEMIERRGFLNVTSALMKGNRLETWDAMLSAEQFSQLFAPSFNGTVYLIVCTSNYVTEVFRRQHADAICICSRDPIRAGLSLAKLDAALRLIENQNIQLWKALQAAGDIIDSIAIKGGFSR